VTLDWNSDITYNFYLLVTSG